MVGKFNIVHTRKLKTMKTIFLISSIFYILGLKIGQKINLFKNYNPVEKITTTTDAVKNAAKTVYFNDEVKMKSKPDTVKIVETVNKSADETKHL